MLPKINRLKHTKDFNTVFKTGKRIRGDCLFLQINNNNLHRDRFAFIVSKNVAKKATVRNRLRRRLAALIKKSAIKTVSGVDIAVVVQPGLERKPVKELAIILKQILVKAGLLQGL